MILSSVPLFVKIGKAVSFPSAPKTSFSLFRKKSRRKPFREKKGNFSSTYGRPHHPYHLVDPSPWPILTSLSILWMMLGFVLFFHKYAAAGTVLFTGICSVIYTTSLWWRDVMREGRQGYHTSKVKEGLNLGMILFIVSEAVFFVGLLWAFMHVALMPTVQIGMMWPPLGIAPVQWSGLPKTNTALLLASYFTANAAKHALDNGDRKGCAIQLAVTIGLGVAFVYCQYLEYTGAPFTFSDSVYGSTFYLTTGFHGFHVIVGFRYLTVCLFTLKSAGPGRSTALDLAVLYWHFVDVVWVFLLVLVYVWGGAVPKADVGLCADGSCVLHTVLRRARLDAYQQDPSFFLSI
uniref:Cytochrome c oxidase subunit 3 n=1 Tax=Rotundella rotunda TaxID=1357779 RepID=A0A076YGZ9_9CHLO|nr:cytochrome c oxidase subunit 3 [Rotundella rotunda]